VYNHSVFLVLMYRTDQNESLSKHEQTSRNNEKEKMRFAKLWRNWSSTQSWYPIATHLGNLRRDWQTRL